MQPTLPHREEPPEPSSLTLAHHANVATIALGTLVVILGSAAAIASGAHLGATVVNGLAAAATVSFAVGVAAHIVVRRALDPGRIWRPGPRVHHANERQTAWSPANRQQATHALNAGRRHRPSPRKTAIIEGVVVEN